MARRPSADNLFRWFDSSRKTIQTVVMLYLQFPLFQREVEDLAFERGFGICGEPNWLWVNRFRPMSALNIYARRASAMRQHTHLSDLFSSDAEL